MYEKLELLAKTYDGESIVDVLRDVTEAFDERFTPQATFIPRDEYGLHKGTFKVSIEWFPGDQASAPLRPRTPEMDAIVKWMHGNPAFTLESAAKAVSAAMAKNAHTRRCEACDGSGRINSSYEVHVPEHGRGAGEVLTTECCDACEGEGRIAVPDDEDEQP